MQRHAIPSAIAAATLAVTGCEAEVDVETGEDAEETIEEHLDD